MKGTKRVVLYVLMFTLILFLLFLVAKTLVLQFLLSTTVEYLMDNLNSEDEYFLGMIIVLLILLYRIQRSVLLYRLSLTLCAASYFIWFFPLLVGYSIEIDKFRILAILFWSSAVLLTARKFARKGNRRAFTQAVRREAICKQRYRCHICKRSLQPNAIDFHHKDGNRSNNKVSNCQVLCTPCHRSKHQSSDINMRIS